MINESDLGGKGWFMVIGIALVLIGIAAIIFPVTATATVEIVLGWILVFNGLLTVIHSCGARNFGGSISRLLAGIVAIVIGFLILTHMLAATIAITLLVAIFLLTSGILKTIISLQMRRVKNWGWLLLNGILSIILGVLFLKNPLSGVWIIGFLIGIDILFGGWAMIMIGTAIGKIKIQNEQLP